MAEIVLRVRMVGGDHMDVVHEDPDAVDVATVLERVIAVLSQDSGALRCSHGDRLVVLYGRGVAAVEASPRGAVL
jgi:hypothetical protein